MSTQRAQLSWCSPVEWETLNGHETPRLFSSLSAEVEVVRQRVGVSVLAHWFVAKLSGADAFDVVDRITPVELYMRDGQMRHTLLLDDHARVLADIYVAAQDSSFLFVVDGMTPAAFRAWVTARFVSGEDVSLEMFDTSHVLIALSGPFAWELLAEIEGPNVIGIPYLSFFVPPDGKICFRTGKTGEFGYDILVPRENAEALWNTLLEKGARFGVTPVGSAALHHCALENWFFNVHVPEVRTLTPWELQLQWRVSARKKFPGSEVLRALRESHAGERIVGFESAAKLETGSTLTLDSIVVGRVLSCEVSETLKRPVGIALVARDLAHSGLQGFTSAGTPIAVKTVSPPFINNISLFLNPQKYAWETRDEIPFPGFERIRFVAGVTR